MRSILLAMMKSVGAQRRNDLVVPDGNRSPTFGQAQLLQALFHDAHRLAHLLHADAVAVLIVAAKKYELLDIEKMLSQAAIFSV